MDGRLNDSNDVDRAGGTNGLFPMARAEAAMISEVYGAECWHGDSGYPIWDSGVNMGSLFEVKTVRVKYENERYLKISVQGSGVCYVHNRYEGDRHTYIVVVKHFCNTCVLIIADYCPGFERSLVTII